MSEKRLLRASGGHSSIECCGIFDVRVVVRAGHLKTGGEGGIRTPDRLAPMPHFECGAFDHSATSPGANEKGDSRARGRAEF